MKFDYHLTQEQIALQQMYREFTDKEIRPKAKWMDETGKMDLELWRKMGELGSFGIVTPEEYGGCGMNYTDLMLVIEEVVRGAGTVYHWMVAGNGPNNCTVLKFGTEEQKRTLVPPLARGESMGAFALTEPGAGSDASGATTKAVLEGDHYVINGTKTFCSNATYSDRVMTIAKTIVDGKDVGFTAFIVPIPSPGLTIAEEHKMGMRGASCNEVSYQDVMVPASSILGEVGQGMLVAMDSLNEARTSVGALCVGLAQEAIDLAVKYSKERMQFGKRISQFQNTQFVLAECQAKVHAARMLTYHSAWVLDQGMEDRALPSMVKYFSSEMCNDVVRKCLQVFGGYGYMKDYPIERIYRDAKVTEIFDGANEIHKVIISKDMGVR